MGKCIFSAFSMSSWLFKIEKRLNQLDISVNASLKQRKQLDSGMTQFWIKRQCWIDSERSIDFEGKFGSLKQKTLQHILNSCNCRSRSCISTAPVCNGLSQPNRTIAYLRVSIKPAPKMGTLSVLQTRHRFWQVCIVGMQDYLPNGKARSLTWSDAMLMFIHCLAGNGRRWQVDIMRSLQRCRKKGIT